MKITKIKAKANSYGSKRKLHDDCRIIARSNIECKVLCINVLACENAYSILAVLRFDKIEVSTVIRLVIIELYGIYLRTFRRQLDLHDVICNPADAAFSKSCLCKKAILVSRHVKNLYSGHLAVSHDSFSPLYRVHGHLGHLLDSCDGVKLGLSLHLLRILS